MLILGTFKKTHKLCLNSQPLKGEPPPVKVKGSTNIKRGMCINIQKMICYWKGICQGLWRWLLMYLSTHPFLLERPAILLDGVQFLFYMIFIARFQHIVLEIRHRVPNVSNGTSSNLFLWYGHCQRCQENLHWTFIRWVVFFSFYSYCHLESWYIYMFLIELEEDHLQFIRKGSISQE